MNKKEHHIISLGGGVQSSTLLLMSARGVFGENNKPKLAIFADTGWEPVSVYKYLDWLDEEAKKSELSGTKRASLPTSFM